jgi:hypothetical protein
MIISALRGSIGRIGPSGATAGAGLGADADSVAAADVAAGVVVARVPAVDFRLGAAAGVFVAGGSAAAGCAGAEASLGLGGVAGAAAPEAGVAIALTALRQGDDSLGSLRTRHSKASLPLGCTPAQLAMKSERQAARTASRLRLGRLPRRRWSERCRYETARHQ